MNNTKEPRTAEEWVSQYLSEAGDLSNDDHFPLFTDIIRRAQEQAKNEAFVECATVCEVRKLITTEIRAYDKGFREGVATTTEKMQIATDVLVREARVQAIEDVLEIVKYKTVFDYSEQEEKARIYGGSTVEVESIDINEVRALLGEKK